MVEIPEERERERETKMAADASSMTLAVVLSSFSTQRRIEANGITPLID